VRQSRARPGSLWIEEKIVMGSANASDIIFTQKAAVRESLTAPTLPAKDRSSNRAMRRSVHVHAGTTVQLRDRVLRPIPNTARAMTNHRAAHQREGPARWVASNGREQPGRFANGLAEGGRFNGFGNVVRVMDQPLSHRTAGQLIHDWGVETVAVEPVYAIRRPKPITLAQALSEMTAQIFPSCGARTQVPLRLVALHFKSEYAMLTAAMRIIRHFSRKPEAVIGADGNRQEPACRR